MSQLSNEERRQHYRKPSRDARLARRHNDIVNPPLEDAGDPPEDGFWIIDVEAQTEDELKVAAEEILEAVKAHADKIRAGRIEKTEVFKNFGNLLMAQQFKAHNTSANGVIFMIVDHEGNRAFLQDCSDKLVNMVLKHWK